MPQPMRRREGEMSDTLDLAAIEARCNAATPGPWRVGYATGRCTLPHVHGVGDCDYRVSWWDEEQLHDITRDAPVGAPYDDAVKVCGNYNVESGGVVHECDAAFIAHAREDIPALLARVRELEARLAALRDSSRDAMDSHSEAARDAIDEATRAERERCLEISKRMGRASAELPFATPWGVVEAICRAIEEGNDGCV